MKLRVNKRAAQRKSETNKIRREGQIPAARLCERQGL